jgi:hypothetical protein
MKRNVSLFTLAAICSLAAVPSAAQEPRSLDLTVNDVGISIGDSRRVVGLRLNFRDRHLEEAVGINATIWTPFEYTGIVRGLALGLPATGARRIDGIAAGLFGVGVSESVRGLTVAGIGVGAGDEVRGIAISGIGLGAGEGVRGIAIGGIGVGAGGGVRGLTIGGVGVGAGGEASGILVGGVGVGVGGVLRGLSIAGVGVGAGESVEGVTITGVGTGAGGDVTGLQIAGIGIGSGGTLRWLSIAGIGIGASSIEGIAVAPAVGTHQARALVLAPAYFRITDGGRVNGVNVSALNDVRGTQQGLAIGIFNYARHLDGLQLGVLNYAANKPRGTRLLPVLNYARSSQNAAATR